MASSSSNNFINFNGTFVPSGTPVLTADNRGFRYGDGVFETITVKNGQIRLARFHFERLMTGARALQFVLPPFFTTERLTEQILQLCEKNGHSAFARVRLTVFRDDGGLSDPGDHFPYYIIQSWDLPPGSDEFNGDGLIIDLFPDGRKSCDPFSNLKSNNFQLYALAALYARKNGLHDCLILNSHGRIADSTIANLFYIRENKIYTPPLSEGCVTGVMRRLLLESLPQAGFSLMEKAATIEDLAGAEEIFLTNALKGIKWVRSFRRSIYSSTLTRAVYQELMKIIVSI
jgi:branched-chain amino acid aminotransferase